MNKEEIRNWWAQNPMTYGLDHGSSEYGDQAHKKQVEFGSKEFFKEADNVFYNWNKPLHDGEKKFGKLFPYQLYKGKKVLEIGCGMGCMAMNWALNGADIAAVDLNPVAVQQTKKRFELFSLKGMIQEEDANNLSFGNDTFDYVYSWGVLHHSPNLQKSIEELMRVLKPGGEFGIMLYNRKSLLHYYMTMYIEGFLHYESNFLSPLELASRYGDGGRNEGNPYTWPVTKNEMKKILDNYSSGYKFKILGTDLDSIFKYNVVVLGFFLPKILKKPWARRFGWSLWMHGKKNR